MSTDIVKADQAAIKYTDEQIQLIKTQIAPNANGNELKLFLYQCQRTGLDALSRQIYCIHRGGKMTIQTSIDGFRVIAERSGVYAGQSEPEFTEKDGKLVNCKVRIFKFAPNGERYEAAVGVAYWEEYAQNSPMWTKMKHTMLSKCAEAIALRKAFPQDLSGLYTADEMEQANTPTVDVQFVEGPTVAEKKLLLDMVYTSSLDEQTKTDTIEWVRNKCHNYKQYEMMQHKLEAAQPSIDETPNPTKAQINKAVKEKVGA